MPDNELQLEWAERLRGLAASGRLSRRDVLRKATVFGLSVPTIGALLAACGSDDDSGGGGETPASSAPAGDTSATTAAPSGKAGGILNVGALTPSTTVDPVAGFDGASIAIFQLVNEYLVWLEPDFSLRPALAESWQPDADGKLWTVKLREGVTFSDGTPLDADTVVASFQRILDPESGSAALSAYKGVLEASGITAVDPATVSFALSRPYSDFPYLISAGVYNSVILKADYAGTYTDNAIGTGPFVLDSFSATDGAKFSKNPTYWNAGKPLLDGIEVKFYDDAQAQVLALQSGEIDTQVTSQLGLLTAVENDPDFTVDTVGGTGLVIFTLRVDTPPFDKKEVRQAIATALDRGAVNQVLYNGIGELGNDHLFAPAFPASPTDIPQRDVDLDKVKELLEAAGATDLSFKLTFEPPTQDYAVVIQEQLKQAGITVELDQRTSDEFYAGDQATDTPWLFTPANLVAWAGRPVPTQFIIPVVKSDGVWNGSKYQNPALDAAADAYDAATTDEEKRAQAELIATTLHEDTPIIITTWSATARPYRSSKWTGIAAHPSSYVDFADVGQV